MPLLIGLDVETSGLEAGVHSVTEVGAILWQTETHSPLRISGYLVNPGAGAVWDAQTIAINGITPELCAQYGMEDERALKQLLLLYREADYAVAHNKDFDRGFVRVWAEKYGYDWQPNKLWIDTNTDLKPEDKVTRHKLTYMAADHAFLNPFPHRAVFDVMTALKILDNYDLEQVLQLARSPLVSVRAITTYEQKELAKERGYRPKYEGKVFRFWYLTLKECFVEKERLAAPFSIEVLPEVVHD